MGSATGIPMFSTYPVGILGIEAIGSRTQEAGLSRQELSFLDGTWQQTSMRSSKGMTKVKKEVLILCRVVFIELPHKVGII